MRSRLLTSQLILDLSGYLKEGNDVATASALVGVSADSVELWRKEGRRLLEAEPEVTTEEWVERGILFPPLELAVDRSLARGYAPVYV